MRVLLDENIDRLLKPLFAVAFEVLAVRERGWQGKSNGELLRAAEQEFDAFVHHGQESGVPTEPASAKDRRHRLAGE